VKTAEEKKILCETRGRNLARSGASEGPRFLPRARFCAIQMFQATKDELQRCYDKTNSNGGENTNAKELPVGETNSNNIRGTAD
jgi:hypothetical protein